MMTHAAIARWTEAQIRSGWAGISDWLLAYKPRKRSKPKPRPKPKPKAQ